MGERWTRCGRAPSSADRHAWVEVQRNSGVGPVWGFELYMSGGVFSHGLSAAWCYWLPSGCGRVTTMRREHCIQQASVASNKPVFLF